MSVTLLYLAHEKPTDSDPVIIPYKSMIRMYTTLYGVATESPSTDLFVSEVDSR